MGKESSKNFRDRIRKNAEVYLEGKNSTRKRSESEILAMYYSEQDIERGERRIEKRIARNREQYQKQGKKYPEAETSKRNYYYVRKIVEPTGKTNYLGITKEEYDDPRYPGYKAKMMASKVVSHGIQVEHRGEYTDAEKKILDQIKRRKENLKGMQETFKDEDSER